MNDRREPNDEYEVIKQKLATLSKQVTKLTRNVKQLDDDFRQHEVAEKPLLDEIIMTIQEVRTSMSGYVELQEDLKVLVRVANKITKVGIFLAKCFFFVGVLGAAAKFAYEWLLRNIG